MIDDLYLLFLVAPMPTLIFFVFMSMLLYFFIKDHWLIRKLNKEIDSGIKQYGSIEVYVRFLSPKEIARISKQMGKFDFYTLAKHPKLIGFYRLAKQK